MTREIPNKIIEYIKINKGKFFGTLIGLLTAILILTIGFLKTILIVLCTCFGFFIGTRFDNGETLKGLLENIFSLIKRR